MKQTVFLLLYFIILMTVEIYKSTVKTPPALTTLVSKSGDAVLAVTPKNDGLQKDGYSLLILGGIDYEIDYFIGHRFTEPCYIDYLYLLPEANLFTFYRLLQRCVVGTVFYIEKDFLERKINLKNPSILKTSGFKDKNNKIILKLSNGASEQRELSLGSMDATLSGSGWVLFEDINFKFLALSSNSVGESRIESGMISGNESGTMSTYLKLPYNVSNMDMSAEINSIRPQTLLCSFKKCLKDPQSIQSLIKTFTQSTKLLFSNDNESIVIKRD